MTLHIPAKVLLHVWSYDFYDMTLSTGKQRRHMIIYSYFMLQQAIVQNALLYCLFKLEITVLLPNYIPVM